MIDEKIEKYLSEARGEDFYADRKNIAERLRKLADRISDMNLPDPDSDYYGKYRAGSKATLVNLATELDKLEKNANAILSKHNY